VRNCTRVIVVSLLAGAAIAWQAGRAGAQPPADGAVTPVRGAWTPRVIATSRPVTEVEPARPAAVQPARALPTDVPSVARTSADAPPGRAPLPDLARPAPSGASLTVEKVGPAAVPFGKPLTYDIVVRNTGAADAQQVRVEEQTPAGIGVTATEPRAEPHGNVLAWDLGRLAAGGEARLRVTLQPPADGDVSTTTTATCATVSTLQVRVTRPNLSLTVSDPAPAQVGQKVTFRIQVANNSAVPLTGLMLRARLAAGLQHPQGSQIEATIPTLAAGEVKLIPLDLVAVKAGRQTLAITVTPTGAAPASAEAGVELKDTASATAPAPVPSVVTGGPEVRPSLPPVAPPPERKPAVAPAVPPPSLPELPPQARAVPPPTEKPIASAGGTAVTLNLADAEAALEVGRETTYEIRVLNQGAAPTRDVLVKAVVPDEMALVKADGPGGQAGQVQGKQVAFGPLTSLDGQGQAVYRVRVKALKPGDGRFTALLQCGTMARPLSQEVNTRVYSDEAPGGLAMEK
jgi:uncharacterized repeat protein (TIGR01451 family)